VHRAPDQESNARIAYASYYVSYIIRAHLATAGEHRPPHGNPARPHGRVRMASRSPPRRALRMHVHR
jgi:hypothetical protein